MADLVPVTIAGLTMDNTPDTDGVRWRVQSKGLVGYTAPAVDVQTLTPTGRDGVARSSGRYRARDVTVRGRAVAPSFEVAWTAYYRLLALTRLGGEFSLVVGEPVPKQLTVKLGDDPDIGEPEGRGSRWRVPFQIPVSAEYPFKRGVAAVDVAVAAGATVSHTAAGGFPAEIEVTCASTGSVDLTIGGLRLRTGSLNAGSKLTSGPGFMNPRRTIRSSTGVNLFGLIVQPMQWPAMTPGAHPIHQAGTADLLIRYFPTWP